MVDFFANCEYFEEKFNYDEVLSLPKEGTGGEGPQPPPPPSGYESTRTDAILTIAETAIGLNCTGIIFQRRRLTKPFGKCWWKIIFMQLCRSPQASLIPIPALKLRFF